MTLPSKPQARAGMPPRRARVLLGASAKVGKTTLLANWAPATTLIVDTHHGTELLDGEHYVAHVRNWPEFVGIVTDICRGGHSFHTIGIDLIGDLWRFADLHFGTTKDGMKIPASAVSDYGRSSAKARSAFEVELGRLLTAPVGIWFLAHLREKTDKEGQLTVYAPDMDKAVHGYVMGAVDFVWLGETQKNGRRVIHTQPTAHFEAGSRVPLPSPLDMDARVIATAMDRALNPQDYDENGERKRAEPKPTTVPPTETPVVEVAPLERRDVKQTPGRSDIPTEDVEWERLRAQISAVTTGPELKSFLVDDLGVALPTNVSSWKRVIQGLSPARHAALTRWLQARTDAKAGVPWGEDRPDPNLNVDREAEDAAVDALKAGLGAEEVKA